MYWTCGQCCVLCMWVHHLIYDRTVHTGHVVSVVCYVMWVDGLI